MKCKNSLLVLVVISTMAACGKKAPSQASRSATASQRNFARAIEGTPNLSEQEKSRLLAEVPRDEILAKQRESDRQELVLPAPAGWQPENARHKLKLVLVVAKPFIRVGQALRYRLEIQNVGREDVFFDEKPGLMASGFIKDGGIQKASHFTFLVTPPGGNAEEIGPPLKTPRDEDIPRRQSLSGGIAEGSSQAQHDAAVWHEEAKHSLVLSLRPGETLATRPDGQFPDRFRDLKTSFEFAKPGTYGIQVVYDDLGDHPDLERERLLGMRAQAAKVSREQILQWDEESRIKKGISLDQEKKKHAEAIRDYSERKREAVGRSESNVVELEVLR